MPDHNVNIRTSNGLEKFRISQRESKYLVTWVSNVVAFATHKELGSATSMEGALALAKSYCKGSVKRVELS